MLRPGCASLIASALFMCPIKGTRRGKSPDAIVDTTSLGRSTERRVLAVSCVSESWGFIFEFYISSQFYIRNNSQRAPYSIQDALAQNLTMMVISRAPWALVKNSAFFKLNFEIHSVNSGTCSPK